MTDEQAYVGRLVRIRDREIFGNVDLEGKLLPAVARVERKYTRGNYRRQWIELVGVAGQFRASQLSAVPLEDCASEELAQDQEQIRASVGAYGSR